MLGLAEKGAIVMTGDRGIYCLSEADPMLNAVGAPSDAIPRQVGGFGSV